MKKTAKCLLIVLLAIVLVLALATGALFVYAAWRKGTEYHEVSQWDMELGKEREVMDVRLESFHAPDVSAMQTIETVNSTGENLEEIVLRVYANGQESLGAGARAVDVTNVYVNDEKVPFAYDDEDPTVVRIAYAWQDGEQIELRWHSSAPLTGDMTLVSLPVPGVYEDGAWRTDAWDPLMQGSYADAFDVDLWMEFNGGIDVVFGGAVLGYAEDPSGNIAHMRMTGARDVTLLVTTGKARRFDERAGVKIAAVADNAFTARALLDQCEKALESLAAAGLAYPFPALTVAQMDTGYEDGYAAAGFAAVGKGKSGEAQLRSLTRLIARQTFGVLVGNDPWNAPWLSQSLSSAAELLAFRQRKGETAFEARFFDEIEVSTRLTRPYGVTVGAGIDRFGGESEMGQVLRDQGAAMLLGIGETIGYDALAQALFAYAQDNAGRIAARADLEAALESVSGSSWTGYLEDELAY